MYKTIFKNHHHTTRMYKTILNFQQSQTYTTYVKKLPTNNHSELLHPNEHTYNFIYKLSEHRKLKIAI